MSLILQPYEVKHRLVFSLPSLKYPLVPKIISFVDTIFSATTLGAEKQTIKSLEAGMHLKNSTYPNPIIRACIQEPVYDKFGLPFSIEPGTNDRLLIAGSDRQVVVWEGPGVDPEPCGDQTPLQGEEVDRPVQRVVPRGRVVDTAQVAVTLALLVVVA